MSVIIKGMRMPGNCFECPCCRHDNRNGIQKEQCNLTLDVFDQNYFERLDDRAQNCPLVELPEKHGRLIDADVAKEALMYEMCGTGYQSTAMWAVGSEISTPTIFEAEGE